MANVEEDPMHVLPSPDAWEFLGRHQLGRLGYLLGDEPNIVPVNYALAGERLLIRTAPGSKLLGVVIHPRVVFEVDEIGDATATSVIVRGTAAHLSEGDVTATAALQPRTWVDTPKFEVIAIHIDEISGRTFTIDRGR